MMYSLIEWLRITICGFLEVMTEAAQVKATKPQEIFGASVDEIWDAAGFGAPTRGKRRPEKKGRRKKAQGGLTPEINKKLGDANLLYANGQFEKVSKRIPGVSCNVSTPVAK